MISYEVLTDEKLKSQEASNEGNQPRIVEKKTGTSAWVYFVVTLLALVVLGLMMSIQLSHDQKTRLLKKDLYWENLIVEKAMKPAGKCVTDGGVDSAQFLDSPAAREFKEFIDYMNFDKQLDYFMCFSTLFYATKVERYEQLTVKKNVDKIMAFEDKCVLWEHAKEDSVPSVAHVHLCTLKSNETRSLVQLVRDFVKYYDENTPTESKLKLLYNKFNGEYQVEFAENLKISFHEYERKYRLSNDKFYDASSILDHLRAAETLDKSKDFVVEEKVTMDTGIIRRLFGYDRAFSVPLDFFKPKPECSYVKYLNTAIKLPNRLNEYIEYFYPDFIIKQLAV